MANKDLYLFHQTPKELAIELIKNVPLKDGDKVVEPFAGEKAFYNNFPEYVIKDYAEIKENRDYTTLVEDYDWVITNPPFRIENKNCFWDILSYYSLRTRVGIAFLCNDKCFSSLTPIRLTIMKERGWYINKIVICNVKKWRGRYYFIIFQKIPNNFIEYLSTSY